MSNKERLLSFLACILMAVILIGVCFFSMTTCGVRACNTYEHALQEADDETSYRTRKQVEDTCRAMISSYESDKRMYMQYKDSEDEENRSWGEYAKTRANKTAASYNNYILKNRYIWKDDVPDDIYYELAYME